MVAVILYQIRSVGPIAQKFPVVTFQFVDQHVGHAQHKGPIRARERGIHSSAFADAIEQRGSRLTTLMPRMRASAIRLALPERCRCEENPSPEPIWIQ